MADSAWLSTLANWLNKISYHLKLPFALPGDQPTSPTGPETDQELVRDASASLIWEAAHSQLSAAPRRGHGGRTGPKILREQFLGADEWLGGGYWAVGVSTNVTALRYAAPKMLFVVFSSRNLAPSRGYRYDGVEKVTAEAMFLSPSLGRFVHQKLKGQYDTQGPLLIT